MIWQGTVKPLSLCVDLSAQTACLSKREIVSCRYAQGPVWQLSRPCCLPHTHTHTLMPTTHTPSTQRPSLFLALSRPLFYLIPFDFLTLVYIVCEAIRVLLAAIMKGIVSICCFFSLLVLALAGKGPHTLSTLLYVHVDVDINRFWMGVCL